MLLSPQAGISVYFNIFPAKAQRAQGKPRAEFCLSLRPVRLCGKAAAKTCDKMQADVQPAAITLSPSRITRESLRRLAFPPL